VLNFLSVPHERFPALALDEPLTISAYNVHIANPLEESFREVLRKEVLDEQAIVASPKQIEIPKNDNLPAIVESVVPKTSTDLIAKYPVTLYRHQIKATKELKHKLLVENKRALLLPAGVGTGKTFIYGALLAELWQSGWFEGRTYSPWPALIITKASIVKQTRRVLENHFKLCPVKQFRVINFDALRSAKGMETVIEKVKKVVNGEQVIEYKWRKFLHPLFVVIDECQSAKNEDSTQSQIIQNLADIEDPNVKMVFSSATPWTRVCEAKYFCVNLGMQYKL
jgi:hypothetical protein